MKIVGIISEYNPFHLGHLHQINCIRKFFPNEKVLIVTIMSGNFIQRGEPSIVDKFKRCEMSLSCGVDLCLELPVQFVLSSAEGFAQGAIKLLDKLGFIDYLCFGCENPDIKKLNEISEFLLSMDKNVLKKYSDLGVSFPNARSLAIQENFKDSSISNFIKSSNNILGIEYVKALKILNSKIKILPIERVGSNYNDCNLDNKFSSATSIRNFLTNSNEISILENHLPSSSYEILKNEFINGSLTTKSKMFDYIKYKLLTIGKIENIEDVNEGLENKFYKEISNSNSLEELILNVKSKRYTYTRLSRILTKYFIGFENFDKDKIKSFDNYVKILAFNSQGLKLLNSTKKISSLTLISKFNKSNSRLAPLDILSTKAYSMLNNNVLSYSDFTNPPLIKK